jgi:hypothetical protein
MIFTLQIDSTDRTRDAYELTRIKRTYASVVHHALPGQRSIGVCSIASPFSRARTSSCPHPPTHAPMRVTRPPSPASGRGLEERTREQAASALLGFALAATRRAERA